ncbi:unnamed protein product [Mytilus edulis]|uniref:Ig-like domain-containing protein n=1 Tax=Mytilus edulis TaxID=6550 RepID=A0A8S3PW79_MYTED|nr:unnamed protein product [Mytilus edulis]
MYVQCSAVGDLVSSQDAFIQLSTNANYQIDKLKFGCSPSGTWGSISRVSLSKNTSSGFREIVDVFLDSGNAVRNKTVWNTQGWQDEGTYRCVVSGASLPNDQKETKEKNWNCNFDRRSSDPTINFQGWLNTDDIVNSDPISSGCQNTQTSRLTFNVTEEYPYTEFRCETGYQNLRCGHSSIISSNITIYRYTAPAVNKPQTDDTASGGVIAGAVIGSFVGIILIVVIVYFVAFRKKNEGETYRTKEENGTGSAPIDNTVYSVPHKERHGDRDRSPRDKSPRQYENRGLDEPHTRGYNADPRGRSNPGMDRSFDDVRDGNMKSSRGPMMGSNASFGSAV